MRLHFLVCSAMKPSSLPVIWKPLTCKLTTKHRQLLLLSPQQMLPLVCVPFAQDFFGRVSPTRDPWFYLVLVQTLFLRSNSDAAMSEFDSAMSRYLWLEFVMMIVLL